jgi:hypothetical protein
LDGCNSPMGCRQTPTRSLPWNLDDYCAYP